MSGGFDLYQWFGTGTPNFGGAAMTVSVGSAALPGVAFSGDPDTGLYWVAANTWGLASGGALALKGSTSLITAALPIGLADGTVGAPGLAFSGDLDTGFYRIGANNWGIAANGAACLSGSATAITASLPVYLPAGTAAAPGAAFASDTNSGFYSIGADQIGAAVGGTLVLSVTATSVASAQPILGPAGAVGTVAIGASADPNTGLYFPAADALGVSAGGTEYLRVTHDATLPVVAVKGSAPLLTMGGVQAIANAATLTAAEHRSGLIYQDASGGNVTCTTLTAALLVAAFPGVAVGSRFPLYYASNHAANTATISGGAGVTLSGSGAITETGGTFLLVFTNVTPAAEAATLIRVG